jgi:ATP-dependent Lhr-like helicase
LRVAAHRRHAAEERRELLKDPADILITTPESLYLLLTSQGREILRGVETLVLDEVHAVAGTKRGAHVAPASSAWKISASARRSGSACRQRSGRSRRSAGSSRAAARLSSSTQARARRSTWRWSCRSRT